MATTTEEARQFELRVGNLDCEHDAAAIERGLERFPGLISLNIYPNAAKVALTYDPTSTSPEVLKEKLEDLGFPPQAGLTLAEPPKPWRNPKVLTSTASGLLLLLAWLAGLAGAPPLLSLGLSIAAIGVGGYYFGREAIEALIFERQIGIELLMSIAAITATVLGEALEGAMLVFLYSLSEAAEAYTEDKTRSSIRVLMNLVPKKALVRRDGREQEVPIEDLQVGEVFIVKPGQAVATDGEVLAGSSSVNQAPVTGESVPVEKQPGESVFAGSINGQGALEVRATRTVADNTIARIIHLVEEAQEQKGQSQRFIERFSARYSPAVLGAAVLVGTVPPLLFQADWETWLTRATVFLVAAAPCALVISIPITLVASLGTAARNGVLVKGGVYVEELAKVRVMALDKTGTLTRGDPEVTDIIVLHGQGSAPSEARLLALAAGLEQRSEHPLARAILDRATQKGIAPVATSNFRALTGAGAKAQVDGGAMVCIGNPALFTQQYRLTLDGVSDDIARLQAEGKTVVLIGDQRAAWGLIALRDNLRPNARQAIAALHASGIEKVVMLTGDNERTARALAREVGIDEVYADLKPEDKVGKVHELTQRYAHVAMVGDGINDAPALAAATVGVAMGVAGTDVALETADVALMADDLEKLAYAVRLAKRNQRVVNQNLALSAVVIGAMVLGAVTGAFTLPMVVLGHEISEFVVIGSGLRMLRS